LSKAPAVLKKDEKPTADSYVRSAINLSLTRTLQGLKRYIGPQFDLEKLWDAHTYYVCLTLLY
jgi:hypothetical protein